MFGWEPVQSRQSKRQQVKQLDQLAQAVSARLLGGGPGQPKTQRPRSPAFQRDRQEWQCGVCLTYNFLDRALCRKCFTAHNVVQTPKQTSPHTKALSGKGKGAHGGKGKTLPKQIPLDATLAAARAAGASEATVAAIVQDAKEAKLERQTLGTRLDSAAAKLKRLQEQQRRCEEAVATALRKQDEAAKAVEDAGRELASLREESAVPASQPVLAEARSLLEVLESSPLCTTSGNTVPEALLEGMRLLREALVAVVPEEPMDFEVGTGEEDEEFTAATPGRSSARTPAVRRTASEQATTRARVNSSSRTPPPAARR